MDPRDPMANPDHQAMNPTPKPSAPSPAEFDADALERKIREETKRLRRERTLQLLLALCILLALVGVLLPALNAQRHIARRMQTGTQLRGIHQSLLSFAQTNKHYYPGALATGTVGWKSTQTQRGASIVRLSDEDYISVDYLISTSETDSRVISAAVTSNARGTEPMPQPGGSFAVLDYRGAGKVGDRLTTLGRAEWKETLSTPAIVLCDRQLTASNLQPRSIWSKKPGEWKGWVLYNDNHADFALTDKGHVGKYLLALSGPGPNSATINNLFDMVQGAGQMTVD